MNDIRISILQTNIVWEDKETNLRYLRTRLEQLSGETEIVVLPEMFSTGFSMRCNELAEPFDGITVSTLQEFAHTFNIAIVGSYICKEDNTFRNRAFFITPEGDKYHYDKRHLFRMGDEAGHYSAGTRHTIVKYKGWNISLMVCYDLRFPIWSRNDNNAYDLLIYVANWPGQRQHVWDTLLCARAIENMAYVCGVNRIGIDGMGLHYDGGSALISPKGERIVEADDNDTPVTAAIRLDELQRFRDKFPAWKDADTFAITK
jgi:predicted amidohydrolase